MDLPRLQWNSPEAFERIRASKPVVLTECPICYPASANWTVERLASIVDENFLCDVYMSSSNRFTYWDKTRNSAGYFFVEPTKKVTMPLKTFASTTKATPNSFNTRQLYLQQSLVAEMGPKILKEYTKFSLETAALFKQIGGWDAMTSNLLLCGREGFVSPLHFDEQENLFAQLSGSKRVRLFAPHCWHKLYVYPTGHPCDRHVQLQLPATPGSTVLESIDDSVRYPLFSTLGGEELFVDLHAGETLYIPQYWFHQMEGLNDGNVSLSWWFKHTSTSKAIDPQRVDLSTISLVAVRRNLEKLVADMCGSPVAAHKFFLSVAAGITPLPPWQQSHDGVGGSVPPELTFDSLSLLSVDVEAGQRTLLVGLDVEERKRQVAQWEAVTSQAISLISLIIPPPLAPGFLLQMVSGRFCSVVLSDKQI